MSGDANKGSEVLLNRPSTHGGEAVSTATVDFNQLIGRVDQCLSEMLLLAGCSRLNVVERDDTEAPRPGSGQRR